ncbi:MAG: hypothetical protein LBK99_18055 [Opitutaceae bacterium]|nr:hypothetical protein [Opitutaceae bacterium]
MKKRIRSLVDAAISSAEPAARMGNSMLDWPEANHTSPITTSGTTSVSPAPVLTKS